MAKLTNEEIIATLKEMTILEINDLVKAIEEEFGVTAAVAAAPVAVATEEAAPAGPTEVTIVLKEVGPTKIAVIKAIKEACGLDLMGAKKIVDGCAPGTPSVLKKTLRLKKLTRLKKLSTLQAL